MGSAGCFAAGAAACVIVALSCPAGAAVVYVNQGAAGTVHDGATWAAAFQTVAAGYAAAAPDDEVWVARGEYRERLVLRDRVTLRGGFVGTETDVSQRSLTPASLTVLDGTNGGTVVSAPPGVSPGTIFDGFHVINGNAHDGGGMVCDGSFPQIVNCWFSGNTADTGGAIYCTNRAGPGIGGNLFENNAAKNGGGALHVQQSFPGISNNVFRNNRTTSTDPRQGFGGAIWAEKRANPGILANQFWNNEANYGGAIYDSDAFHSIGNSLFYGNAAVYQGGAIALEASQAFIDYNTIVANMAPQGGALAQLHGSSASPSALHNNVIAWNSTGVYDDASGGLPPAWSHNDVYGNGTADWVNLPNPTGANGNIHADPVLVDVEHQDLRLSDASPCIDAGDRTAQPWPTDLEGNPRVRGAQSDMGAYEALVPGYTVVDVARALAIAGGLATATSQDIRRLDFEQASSGLSQVTVSDALRAARKAAGLDSNP